MLNVHNGDHPGCVPPAQWCTSGVYLLLSGVPLGVANSRPLLPLGVDNSRPLIPPGVHLRLSVLPQGVHLLLSVVPQGGYSSLPLLFPGVLFLSPVVIPWVGNLPVNAGETRHREGCCTRMFRSRITRFTVGRC